MATQQKFKTVNVETTENGFLVRAAHYSSNAGQFVSNSNAYSTYSFESFASLSE